MLILSHQYVLPQLITRSIQSSLTTSMLLKALTIVFVVSPAITLGEEMRDVEFFEKRIRPLLVKHCYECHSEQEKEQMGGLLLDRRSGWIKGGDTKAAIIPGEPKSSLLIQAIQYEDENLQMPPDGKLSDEEIELFKQWVERGADGPTNDLSESEFSQLGDQDLLFAKASEHWAFQPISNPSPPEIDNPQYSQHPIDRFIFDAMQRNGLSPARPADPRTLLRRLSHDLTGLPPTHSAVINFRQQVEKDRRSAVEEAVDRFLESPAFGERFARMWLDVARYADTDSTYRADTKTPHYFPFAFSYRDYVIQSFNADKPFDVFIKEQLAADLMGYAEDAPELAALGFLTVGPHARRSKHDQIDDWIDVTSRGLLGLTVACARCHDHKYEPVPTADYYALYGVFASVDRPNALSENALPILGGEAPTASFDEELRQDYLAKRKVIEAKIKKAGNKKSGGNNRSVAQKIRETELAELLLFHPAAPSRAMVVRETKRPFQPSIFIRGESSNRGKKVPRHFLTVLDEKQTPFSPHNSGRLQLASRIVSPDNPLAARVFVNRIWGLLMGGHLVETPSNFGVQTPAPLHAELLDWLANDFMEHDWSLKHLVRQIVLSNTYRQSSSPNPANAEIDPNNQYYWRANRKHLSIEQLRDGMLSVSGSLDDTRYGHPFRLWTDAYSRRRSIYGYINRFNLDPTLRAFDFPTPMQTQPGRTESIVATQSLFAMNSPFVRDQSVELTKHAAFTSAKSDTERIEALFHLVFQRSATAPEIAKVKRFVELQGRSEKTLKTAPPTAQTWPLIAQSLLMSNEFQYLD